MAAYFTHCNLQPVHLILTLRTALNLCFKVYWILFITLTVSEISISVILKSNRLKVGVLIYIYAILNQKQNLVLNLTAGKPVWYYTFEMTDN